MTALARTSAPLSAAAIARLIALLLPLALLAGAYGSQYWGGLYPCEMCWWQRYAHMAALVPAALAFTAPAESSRSRNLTLLAALGIAVSGVIGVYHAGVEAKISALGPQRATFVKNGTEDLPDVDFDLL